MKERGSGISVQPGLVAALERTGIARRKDLGVPIEALAFVDDKGRLVGRSPTDVVVTSWGHLYRQFLAHVPADVCRFETRVLGFTAGPTGVEVRLSGGASLTCDWLIGADGYFSTVRAQLVPDVAPEFAGYIAWRGVLAESELNSIDFQLFERHFCLHHPADHGYFLGFFIPGVDGALVPGQRRLTWAWLRNIDGETHRRYTQDRNGRQLPVSMYEGGLRDDVTSELRSAARAILPPPFADLVARTRLPYFQGIVDALAPQTVFGRTVLIGDAACIVRPQTGAGALKAWQDAESLASALAADRGLAVWQQDQHRFALRLVDAGRRAAAASRLGWSFHTE